MDGRILHPQGARFAALYGAYYLAFGAFLPYLPVWLETRGLSPELIGYALAGTMVGRMVLAPLGAAWMDGASRRRDAIVGFAWVGLAGFLLLAPARDMVLIAVLAAFAGALFSGQIPLMDAFAAWSSRKQGFAFGPPRAFGSATFIFANLVAGWLIGRFGGEAALYWMAAGAALTVAVAYFLPSGAREEHETRSKGLPWRHLLKPQLAFALAASALIQSSHGFYYAFSAISWQAQGISPTLVGALWSTGVLVEIVFLALSGRYLSRFHPAWLLIFASGFAVVRWTLTAFAPPLALLFLLQVTHAGTFAAAYLGFLRYASEHSPDHLQASTQAANSALSGGIALALMTSLSGWAYDSLGTAGFAMMAIPAILGGACAVQLLRLRAPQSDLNRL